MKTILFFSFLIFAVAVETNAQNTGQHYNLFKPVPKAQLREMETDRPDVTESPVTVDAGHFQYETDLFRFERTNTDEGLKKEYLFNQANLKLGVFSSTAIQLVVQSYVIQIQKSESDANVAKSHGIGDLTLRIKQNILGNDKGKFALAVLPYIKFPTSKADEESRYEGGIIVPMSYKFTGGWKLGMQLEADRVQDEIGDGLHTEFLESLTISHPIIEKLDAIGETYYIYDLKAHHFNNFLNAALQMELMHDFKVDCGINYGIQQDAKTSYFVGLSFRL